MVKKIFVPLPVQNGMKIYAKIKIEADYQIDNYKQH